MQHLAATHCLTTLFCLWLAALPGWAQTGIRLGVGPPVPPDASAALEVVSSNKGVLVPRMLKSDRVAIASPAEGLLVFQTDAPAGFPAGFWYFQGGSWQQLPKAGGAEFWKPGGNAATTPGPDFLGTTDAQDLVLKTQGAERLRLKVSGALWSSMSVGTANLAIGSLAGATLATDGHKNTLLGHEAGRDLNTGDSNTFLGAYAGTANTIGCDNTAVGSLAGRALTTGHSNTMLGYLAGLSTTSAGFNTFVGTSAGSANTTGFNNTFLGHNAGRDNSTAGNSTLLGRETGRYGTGAGRTMVGSLSGLTDRTGTHLTLLGYQADVTGSALTNAGAIGHQALVSQSNSLVLGGTAGQGTAIKVGIGTSAPSRELEVAGSFQVSRLASASASISQATNNQTSSGTLFEQLFTLPVTGGTITSVSLNAAVAATGVGLRIFNDDGVVLFQTVTLAAGTNLLPVSMAALPQGQYRLHVSRAAAISLHTATGDPYPGNDLAINSTAAPGVDLVFAIGFTTTGPAATPALLATSTGLVGINTPTPAATLHVGGAASTVRLEGLGGSGSGLVAVDNTGTLSPQEPPTLAISGQTLTLTSGPSTSSATLPSTDLSRYGDGSAGALTVNTSTSWSTAPTAAALNGQFTSFTVASGAVLTVPSGTVIRCTGAVNIAGRIDVLSGTVSAREAPVQPGVARSAAGMIVGSAGGIGVATLTAARLPLYNTGGGGGGQADGDAVGAVSGGDGGGCFSLLAAGPISVGGASGMGIYADGTAGTANSDDGSTGGGGGGVVTLISRTSIALTSANAVGARGGSGGGGDSTPNTTSRGGGGGGGGIIRLYAPSISGAANADASGGVAGATVNNGTSFFIGSFPGGGCGGSGGSGAGSGSTSSASAGSAGDVISILTANPENLVP